MKTLAERLRAAVVPGHNVVPNELLLEAAGALELADRYAAAVAAEQGA